MLAVGIYFRYTIVDFITDNAQNKDYIVSFSVENIRYTTPDYINIGDKVYIASSGNLMGELISESENRGALNVTPVSEYFFVEGKDSPVEVFYPSETRINAKGRMICSGRFSDDKGFRIDGVTYISPGQQIAVKTELVSVTITILSIELADQ